MSYHDTVDDAVSQWQFEAQQHQHQQHQHNLFMIEGSQVNMQSFYSPLDSKAQPLQVHHLPTAFLDDINLHAPSTPPLSSSSSSSNTPSHSSELLTPLAGLMVPELNCPIKFECDQEGALNESLHVTVWGESPPLTPIYPSEPLDLSFDCLRVPSDCESAGPFCDPRTLSVSPAPCPVSVIQFGGPSPLVLDAGSPSSFATASLCGDDSLFVPPASVLPLSSSAPLGTNLDKPSTPADFLSLRHGPVKFEPLFDLENEEEALRPSSSGVKQLPEFSAVPSSLRTSSLVGPVVESEGPSLVSNSNFSDPSVIGAAAPWPRLAPAFDSFGQIQAGIVEASSGMPSRSVRPRRSSGHSVSRTIATTDEFGLPLPTPIEVVHSPPESVDGHSSNSSSSTTRRGRKQSLTEDPSKTFVCTICARRFRRQEHLKRHYRSLHTQDKPFKCPDCGKTFSRSDNLTQHQRTHGSGSVTLGLNETYLQQQQDAEAQAQAHAHYFPPVQFHHHLTPIPGDQSRMGGVPAGSDGNVTPERPATVGHHLYQTMVNVMGTLSPSEDEGGPYHSSDYEGGGMSTPGTSPSDSEDSRASESDADGSVSSDVRLGGGKRKRGEEVEGRRVRGFAA